MIYDCFMFNDELDLLEIRLNHHSKFVDKFILIESTKTYTGIDKPLYFQENKDRYKEFKDKIYHIILDYPFINNDNWQYEHMQRNILKGFNFKPDDWIIYADCDEILREWPILNSDFNHLQMDLCFYYFNLKLKNQSQTNESYHLNSCFKNKWHMAKIISPVFLKAFDNLYEIRQYDIDHPGYYAPVIINTGWHFSNLGSVERNYARLNSISHANETLFKQLTKAQLKHNKNSLKDPLGRDGVEYEVITDLPEYIIKNKDKFKEYFHA